MQIWTLAITDALDSLEDRLHYSLQKQDLADKVRTMKREAALQAEKHKNDTKDMKAKLLSQESELQKSAHSVAKYKQRLDNAMHQVTEAQKSLALASKSAGELGAELAQVKQERNLFQSQLVEHKSKVGTQLLHNR